MAMFKSVMQYLGLGPDEEYDDRYLGDDGYVDEEFVDEAHTESRPQLVGQPEPAPRVAAPAGKAKQPSAVGAVRPLRAVDADTRTQEASELTVRKIDLAEEDTSRPMALQRTKPRALAPQSFGDAKILADDFKRSIPVIMNLQGLDRELARRLIDFASGVCYSLGGSMEKMAPQVFLLTPRSVEVSDEDRRRIEERGFDR